MAITLSEIKTPYVNGVTAVRVLSNEVKENIFQQIFTKPGEAVTEKFSTDTNAAEIQIIRVKPHGLKARELGAVKNGGFFNSGATKMSSTEAYPIRILKTIDDMIDIPTSAQDMVSVDLLAAEIKNLSGDVSNNINAATLASYIAKAFSNDGLTVGNPVNLVAIKEAAGGQIKWLDYLLEASCHLDDGNPTEGISVYPEHERAIFIRSDVRKDLLKAGSIITGATNPIAQKLIETGGLSEGVKKKNTTGYVGEIDGMPVYVASKTIWNLAAEYLGVAPEKLDGIKGLVVSMYGTGRALAFNNEVKQIPCPIGQGIRLQPLYRFGVESWDNLAVAPIVTKEFFGTGITATTFGVTGGLSLMAPGSR